MKNLPWLNTAGAATLAIFLGAPPVLAAPWSFGIMCDTQWPISPDNKNPNVAVNVINHLNEQFIGHGVKFVVQVGDLTDNGSTQSLDIRASFAQALYNVGIGFYPLRGNHESSAAGATEFTRIFPQTQTGFNGRTPLNALITTTYYGPPIAYSPATPSVGLVPVGSNFAGEPGIAGLTYSFDYDNARFVLIDQFPTTSAPSHQNLTSTDVDWIGGRLASRPANTHAFVFAHKHLISENHNDNLFNSSNPDAAPASTTLTNSYMAYLQNNGVRYHIGGHDHMHNRAIVTSPDGNSRVQNIIAASDSYKFYIPPTPLGLAAQAWRSREKQIAQELFTVGYYIVTVDGPRVTIDAYASPNGCNGDCDQKADVIPYSFTRRESFGYSLNGKEVVVDQGQPLAMTDDTAAAVANGETGYTGTRMAILDGINASTGKDYSNRALTKTVDTGWAPKTSGTQSDILTLWGLHDTLATDFSVPATSTTAPSGYQFKLKSDKTDEYVLAMSVPNGISAEKLASGLFGLATRDAEGHWINAVAANDGGAGSFVRAPYVPGDALGTYGIDTSTNTVWAVLNHQGEFAVADFATGAQQPYALVSSKAGPAGARVWTLKLINGPEPVEGARIDNLTLTQTSGAACTPVLGKPTASSSVDDLTPYVRPVGDIGPSGSALNSVQLDFTNCAATARFTAAIDYSADGGVAGTTTLYNQFR